MTLTDLFDTSDRWPSDTRALDSLGSHAAALHVSGERLLPEAVTALLGVQPTGSETAGTPVPRPDGRPGRVSSSGRWSLGIARAGTDAMNFNEAIEAVLAPLPTDVTTWRAVGALGSVHIALNLAADAGNGEIWLEPRLLSFLGERGIGLYVEIYQPDPDLDAAQHY